MMEKLHKTKSEEDGKSDIRGFSLTELFIERNNEEMALKIRVERFHLFRFFLT